MYVDRYSRSFDFTAEMMIDKSLIFDRMTGGGGHRGHQHLSAGQPGRGPRQPVAALPQHRGHEAGHQRTVQASQKCFGFDIQRCLIILTCLSGLRKTFLKFKQCYRQSLILDHSPGVRLQRPQPPSTPSRVTRTSP